MKNQTPGTLDKEVSNYAKKRQNRILARLQELDELHEFTPAQQEEYDRLEQELEYSDWEGYDE